MNSFQSYYFMERTLAVKDIDTAKLSPREQRLLQKGYDIADKLGVSFKGWQEGVGSLKGQFLFNDDDETGSSFTARDENEARKKLADRRNEFAMA